MYPWDMLCTSNSNFPIASSHLDGRAVSPTSPTSERDDVYFPVRGSAWPSVGHDTALCLLRINWLLCWTHWFARTSKCSCRMPELMYCISSIYVYVPQKAELPNVLVLVPKLMYCIFSMYVYVPQKAELSRARQIKICKIAWTP